jgi:hypothetical protein
VTTDIEFNRLGIVQIKSGEKNTGVKPVVQQPQIPIGTALDPNNVELNLQRLTSRLTIERRFASIASFLGMSYFFGDVSDSADSKFTHDIGAIPSLIVFSVNVDGDDGRVVGNPEATSGNSNKWTTTEVYVRATVAGRYGFFVM